MRALTSATQARPCNHVQTQACALGRRLILRSIPFSGIGAQRGKPAVQTHRHTHKSTHFQSPPASCLPTLHLIKPLCEPDKAGEGTQQPLNTGAGCIRRLSIPVDCSHTGYCTQYCMTKLSSNEILNCPNLKADRADETNSI